LSGVKINPGHFGCVYNVGCSYYFEKKFLNALKWFEMAIQIDSKNQDCYYGKAAACLKLGRFKDALAAIEKVDEE